MASIGRHYHVAFQVHDEIIITAPDEKLTHAQELVLKKMSTAPKWAPTLPVACELGVGKNYGEAK
jgi:DNA polymerase I-like protein with 3'-5' exonuclease and polymerase domains